jgi:hypothetical protein
LGYGVFKKLRLFMPSLKEWIMGSPDKLKKIDTGTPEMKELHGNVINQANQLGQGGYQQAQNYYNNLLQPGSEAFQNFSSPYMQQFMEQILPMIGERFAGMGALSSSGFGQALGGAGAGLQAQLAQLFASLQNQAAGAQTGQYNQLTQQGLGYQPFAYNKQKGSEGFLSPFISSLASSAGESLGGMFGGGSGGGGGGQMPMPPMPLPA